MSQCYGISGKPQPNFVPCLPGNITSPCCGATDLCMSNGLCLNADGNQAYTIQGCTSSNWAEPCKEVCSESDKTDGSGMFYVGYCWDSNPSSGTNDQWCCGHDCCKNQTATKFELPVAKQIYSPGQVSVIPSVTVTTTLSLPPPTGIPSSLPISGFVPQERFNIMGGVMGALLGLALIPLFALVFRAVRAHYWRHEPLGSRAPRSQATTTTALGGGWEQNSSGQQVNVSLENNTAQRARDSIRSPTSHDAGHYRQSLNNQSLVEESCNQNSILSRTSQDLLDN